MSQKAEIAISAFVYRLIYRQRAASLSVTLILGKLFSSLEQQTGSEGMVEAPAVMSPTFAEVNLRNLRNNFRLVKNRVAPSKVMAVVKANAYGHGLRGIARILAAIGVDYFGVSQVREGVMIRDEGLSVPTLILGPLLREEVPAALHYDLEMSAVSAEHAKMISSVAQKHGRIARVHIKVDTGMGRVGFNWMRTADEIVGIFRLPYMEITGIFTHFAVAVKTHFAREQLNRFFEVLFQLEKRNIVIPLKHAANSGAILHLPEIYLDMVRSGIMLYGYFPSNDNSLAEDFPLAPIMTLHSKVKQLKQVEAGTGISYGHSFVTREKTCIASIPVGYGDGFCRALSNKASVLIKGNRFPVIGKICMDWMMVDAGINSGIVDGDEVVIFGRQGENFISMWELAELAGTTPYEMFCNISERVPRVYTDPDLIQQTKSDQSVQKIHTYS